jgi:hypothetical protein
LPVYRVGCTRDPIPLRDRPGFSQGDAAEIFRPEEDFREILSGRGASNLVMNIDASGKRIVGRRWQALRNRMCEHRLRLWRGLETAVDRARNPRGLALVGAGSAGMVRQGVAEAAPGGPARHRYYRQPDPCELRDRYLPRLKTAIASAYQIGPVTADDLVMLAGYLRAYVADEDLRQELFEAARAASGINGH